ncbi:MAG: hypothetical protein AAGE83_09290 [Pseudomonadota bacterium]
MSRIGFALSIIAIVAIAAWAYNVNYRTGEALARVEDLRVDIARTREDVQVLRVEWAWLNTPERLSRLVAEHRAALALEPMVPGRFGDAQQVPFPPPADYDPLEAALMAALSGAEQSILAQAPLPDRGAAPRPEPDPRLLPLLDDAPRRRLVPVALLPGEFDADGAPVEAEAVATGHQPAADALAAAIDEAVARVVGERSPAFVPDGDAALGGPTLGVPAPAPGPAVTRGLARVVEAGGGRALPAEPSTRGAEPSGLFLRQMSAAQAPQEEAAE